MNLPAVWWPTRTTTTIATLTLLCTLGTLCGPIDGRSTFATTENVAPKSCQWLTAGHGGTGPDDTPATGYGDEQETLACKLKTISKTENLLGSLGNYHLGRIRDLRLECSDTSFVESSLEPSPGHGGFLEKLTRLEQLSIEFCKIRYVPATVLSRLRGLRALALRTHNNDWASMSLELHADSFSGLTELRTLDLSGNNIWQMPNDIFCPLFSLRHLNLTGNRLNDVSQLGFSDWGNGPQAPGKACNTNLEVLDLAGNDLAYMLDNGMSAMRSLQILLLQDNLLTSLGDRAFVGMTALKKLNMSSNRLLTLPAEIFHSSRKIEEIYLQNNSLSVLAPNLFAGLDRLEVLDLSQNELTSLWINRDTFAGLVRLVVLNLASNALTKIDTQVFRGIYSLQILNLEHNLIEVIDNNAFGDLKNLHALTLSHNKLKRIEAFHMSELYVLNQLYLESNLIEEIHPRAFENLTNLNDLNLNDNQLGEVPDGLGQLRFLKSLDLGKNKIRTVNNASFEGLEELLGLRLVDNQITNISRDAFIALTSIHVLNIASNQIRHIDQSAFSSNPTIRAIRLDNNLLEDISSVFTSLPALVWLNISDNRLRWFDYSHLPMSLEWLDMHKNNVSELGNYFDVLNLQIQLLDVSENRLTELEASQVPNSIQHLMLDHNLIHEIAPRTFYDKHNLVRVSLTHNELRRIDIGAFALADSSGGHEMPEFLIGQNPIHCDCNMEWLQRVNELSHLRQHPRVVDLDKVMCTTELDRVTAARPLTAFAPADFLCKYEEHCFALCHCCTANACDCKMTCPDRCSCYHDHLWNTNIVDCGTAGYTEMPSRIPMDATTIYLDGNHLGHIGADAFTGKKKLENLYLNGSMIGSLHTRSFQGAPNVRLLNLAHNRIDRLSGAEFEPVVGVRELYLDHNTIAQLENNTFRALRSLEVMTLADNRIVDFLPWQQLATGGRPFALLSLDGNRWQCDCHELSKLGVWFDKHVLNTDLSTMLCRRDNRTVSEALKQCTTDASDDTPQPPLSDAVQRPTFTDSDFMEYLPIFAAISCGLLGTFLLIAIVCVFRYELRLWAHSRYGVRLFKDPTLPLEKGDDNEKLYDGYMVYSVRDSDFVIRDIAVDLEQAGYSLCLHHRDIHSAAFLADSLHSAAEASRKLILCISMNFLQMEWSDPHFRAALQAVLELIRPSRRQHKLVLLLTAPANLVARDPLLDILMRTCTVIYWGDKRFWDKLRFAMPDVKGLKPLAKVDVKKSPNLRYTPAPTAADTWHRGGTGIGTYHMRHPQPPYMQDTPSHSAYNTEDELSLSQHYEPPPEEAYRTHSTASLGHVYSTIPETPPLRNNAPYFV